MTGTTVDDELRLMTPYTGVSEIKAQVDLGTAA